MVLCGCEHRLRASESRYSDGKAAEVKDTDTDTGASQDYAYVARIGAGSEVGLPSRLADLPAGPVLDHLEVFVRPQVLHDAGRAVAALLALLCEIVEDERIRHRLEEFDG